MRIVVQRIVSLSLPALLIAFAETSFASSKPSDQPLVEADQIARAISKVIDDTNLWHKKPRPQRIQLAREAAALASRAEQNLGGMSGPYASCAEAATMAHDYVLALNNFSDAADGTRSINDASNLFGPMRTAVRLGDLYRQCRADAAAMKKSRPRSEGLAP